MNYVSASTLRNNLADSLDSIKNSKTPLLVSKRGKVVAGLVDIDLLEDLLELHDKEYLKSIKKAREEIKKGEVYTHEEVFGEV